MPADARATKQMEEEIVEGVGSETHEILRGGAAELLSADAHRVAAEHKHGQGGEEGAWGALLQAEVEQVPVRYVRGEAAALTLSTEGTCMFDTQECPVSGCVMVDYVCMSDEHALRWDPAVGGYLTVVGGCGVRCVLLGGRFH
jgi:hypothetical protein